MSYPSNNTYVKHLQLNPYYLTISVDYYCVLVFIYLLKSFICIQHNVKTKIKLVIVIKV